MTVITGRKYSVFLFQGHHTKKDEKSGWTLAALPIGNCINFCPWWSCRWCSLTTLVNQDLKRTCQRRSWMSSQSPFPAGTMREQGILSSLNHQPVWRPMGCASPWFLEELLWGVFSKLIHHTEAHTCAHTLCKAAGNRLSRSIALIRHSRHIKIPHFSEVTGFSKATGLSKSQDLKISPVKSCLSSFFGNWLVIHWQGWSLLKTPPFTLFSSLRWYSHPFPRDVVQVFPTSFKSQFTIPCSKKEDILNSCACCIKKYNKKMRQEENV